MLAPENAKALLTELHDSYALCVKIQSAPSVSLFSGLNGTIEYDNFQGKLSLGELFDINEDVLTGRSGASSDKLAAVRRLVKLITDDEKKATALEVALSEERTERLQFLDIADKLLKYLTPHIALNRLSYSDDVLLERGISMRRAYIGIGSILTWHGTPDGRAEWTQLRVSRTRREVDDESESDLSSSGGKTTYNSDRK